MNKFLDKKKPRVILHGKGSRIGKHFLQKVRNTFFTPRFLYNIFIKNSDYEYYLFKKKKFLVTLNIFLSKLFWFWPKISNDFVYDTVPTKYYYEIDEVADFLVKTVAKYCNKNMKILDLGCNVGRHIEFLHKLGYQKLYGVDVSRKAITEFKKTKKKIFEIHNIQNDFFQRYLNNSSDLRFDTIYSHGATIEIVHPSYDIVKNMCRVTKKYIILIINEHFHYFPRFYSYEFEKNGFYMINAIRPLGQVLSQKNEENPNSLLIFKKM